MGYLKKRHGSRQALGMSFDQIFSNAENAIGTAVDITSDPYLPELVCRLLQLKQVQNGQTPGSCADTPAGIPGGFGIQNAIVPLRGYVYAQQHKWVYPLAVLAILGVPMLIGYELGKP